MSLYRIKPLEWSQPNRFTRDAWEVRTGTGHWFAVRNFVRGGWHFSFEHSCQWTPCDSLEAGKAACEAHWRAKLAEVLEEVPDDWADTQRLDWLINESNEGRGWLEDSVWDATTTVEEPCGDDVGKLIRCAIDAAIKEGK